MAAKLYDTTRMSRYYNGPVSDHFDGARFFDPHGAPPRSRRDLLRWFVDRHWRATKSKWPAWAPSPYADRPPARIDGAAWRISYVGHASWLRLQVSISCSTRCGRSVRRLSALPVRNGST